MQDFRGLGTVHHLALSLHIQGRLTLKLERFATSCSEPWRFGVR
jgi:hypothetical protein